jgi:hypothetical protein
MSIYFKAEAATLHGIESLTSDYDDSIASSSPRLISSGEDNLTPATTHEEQEMVTSCANQYLLRSELARRRQIKTHHTAPNNAHSPRCMSRNVSFSPCLSLLMTFSILSPLLSLGERGSLLDFAAGIRYMLLQSDGRKPYIICTADGKMHESCTR